MIVTFCGHRDVYHGDEVSAWLDSILPPLIEAGADTFYLGGYGGFDELAASAVRRQKQTYPQIETVFVLAYLNTAKDTSGYDSTIYPPLEKVPPRYAISRRNRWLVETSDVIVAYVKHGWGGAAQTLSCAKQKGKTIIQYPSLSVEH